MARGVVLGREVESGRPVVLTDLARSTHVHVVGSTGTGKSKLLEHMIREDIRARRGLCLIDPHGRLYGEIVAWLAQNPQLERPVILFNPADDEYTTGYNPLRRTAKDLAHQVDEMVGAFARVWGSDDMDATPRLKKCLRLVLTALAERQRTLLDAQPMVDPSAYDVRRYLAAPLAGTLLGDQWRHYNDAANPREFAEEFSSTVNRLVEFLSAPRLRRILGQSEHALDLRQIMDQGGILLVNLSTGGRLSRDNARLLGTLLVNDLFLTATERAEGARPFHCYIDECHYYLSEDIARILDEARKFGLHLVLAHQHLSQLKEAGSGIYASVMTDAKTKVIFGGLSADDARVLAEQVYMGQFDIDEVKLTLMRTFEHHRLERVPVISETQGTSDQIGGSDTTSKSTPAFGLGFGDLGTTTRGSTGTSSSTRSESTTKTLTPMLVPEEDQEVSSVQFRSLEEQLYRAMSAMVNQRPRRALLKVLLSPVRSIEITKVSEPYASEETVRAYELRAYQSVPFCLPTAKAEAIVNAQAEHLLEDVAAFRRDTAVNLDEKVREDLQSMPDVRPEPIKLKRRPRTS